MTDCVGDGERGTGKTMTLCHVVHYCAKQGWLVLHIPDGKTTDAVCNYIKYTCLSGICCFKRKLQGRPVQIIFVFLQWRRFTKHTQKKTTKHQQNKVEHNVAFIYKKGPKEDLGNYRPVILTLVAGKVVEWVILNGITPCARQVGYQAQSACIHERQVLPEQLHLLL